MTESSTNKIILASGNAGKLKELQKVLSEPELTLIPQAELDIEDAEETGLTFIENALIKARHAAEQSGLPAIADDSGLAIAALNGAPGIYSSRYAGEQGNAAANIDKVLTELKDVPAGKREAYFYCVIVYLQHAADPTPIVCQGRWQGSILLEKRGTQGFGYDPIFYVPTHKCSAAELTLSEKNSISHRGQALQQLKRYNLLHV